MIDISLLFRNVFMLFLMMIPGFIVRKAGICDASAKLTFSNIILYVTTPAMIVVSFIRPFDRAIMADCLWVLLFSFVGHALFFLLTLPFFRRAEVDTRKVWRFSVIFANAGYMGIPLIISLLGGEAAIYAAFYIAGFNFFMWSLGALIFTGDRKYMSLRKMFLNPATIPTYIGLLLFILPIKGYIPTVVTDCLESFRDTIAPMSMMLVGMQLATVKPKTLLSARLALASLLRLIVCPLLMFAILRLFSLFGWYHQTVVADVCFICASTPAATATGMFAEKFGGDREAAGKVVAFTTILSLITMPTVALIMKFY